ncbi:MAG: class I SAM-dependent methyltransferase [Candidatus Omnitrophica bacterium]|nr:class I SAM-dependent methyltransferase [Candidatus Omnitrophota bacterium]
MPDNPGSWKNWKNFYRNCYAGQWETFSETLSRQAYHRKYQDLCLMRLKEIRHGRILEVGAGRGDLLARYPDLSNELYGCDLSEGNLLAARERFTETGRPVYLGLADAEYLPYADNRFDAVYSLSVLWYLPHPGAAIREMFRVAKPGGMVLFDMLNAFHVTTLSNHAWRILCRWFGRELGRTSFATPGWLARVVGEQAAEYHVYGNFLALPAGLPVLKEAGNWCRFVPRLAYAMTEGPGRVLAHKLLVTAIKR